MFVFECESSSGYVFPVMKKNSFFRRHFVENCIVLLRCLFSFGFDQKNFETKFQRFDQKVLLFASLFQTACLQTRNSVSPFCFRSFHLGPSGMVAMPGRNWYIVSETLVWCELLISVRLKETSISIN